MAEESIATEEQLDEQDEVVWRDVWAEIRPDLLLMILLTIVFVQFFAIMAVVDHGRTETRAALDKALMEHMARNEASNREIIKLQEENDRLKKELERRK